MSESLEQSLKALCKALAALWQDSSFSTSYRSLFLPRYEVITKADGNAALMPASRRPIRGSTGVEVSRRQKELSEEEATEDLIADSFQQEQSFHPEGLGQRLGDIRDAVAAFGRVVDADLPLGYRLHQPLGFKTWSPSQFADHQVSRDLALAYFCALGDRLARSLVAHGFDPASRSHFEGWAAVEEEITQQLDDLRTLDRYEYEVQIFLNGPPPDFEGEASFDLVQDEETIPVAVCYASDHVVSQLVEYEYQRVPGYGRINTVLRYRISLPVEDKEESYLQAYAQASEIGSLLLDGLRLLRPGDDIGILALEIVADDFAPAIRKTGTGRFQTELARFYPTRSDFRSSQCSTLQEQEVTDLGRLVSLLAGKSGRCPTILQARRRFANSIDRYAPDDPEKLIEYAIALESLFLSDASGDRNELSYRLRLRAARLLEDGFKSRLACFDTIGHLYKFRSRIAHGGTLEELKSSEQEQLEGVLRDCPTIVSKSIRAILERGPTVAGKKPVDYWRELELDDRPTSD